MVLEHEAAFGVAVLPVRAVSRGQAGNAASHYNQIVDLLRVYEGRRAAFVSAIANAMRRVDYAGRVAVRGGVVPNATGARPFISQALRMRSGNEARYSREQRARTGCLESGADKIATRDG